MPKKKGTATPPSYEYPEPSYGGVIEEAADEPAVERAIEEPFTEEVPVEIKELPSDNEYDTGNNEVESSEQHYLFLVCIECTGMILVKYPSNASCRLRKELGLDYQSILTFTTCKDCIVKHTPDVLLKLSLIHI